MSKRILKVNEKRMVLAELDVILDQLLSCALYLLALNLVLVCIFRVLIVKALSVTIDTEGEDILRFDHRMQ